MSTLTAFPFIAEGSEATPGLWNRMFSQVSDNLASVQSDAITGHFQQLSVGSTPPSYLTTAAITVAVNSNQSDYLYLTDSAAQRSSYVIGSRAGGTADGLNIWDASGQTMLVSFSKQSIRFYQQVVGPVFDVGGALADTLNAATFGTGADSKESRIQAAISAASTAGISRVYTPASMYPYSAGSISFDTRVLMVREGGDWTVYDVRAYGAAGNNILDDTAAILGAVSGASGAGGGVVYLPRGDYLISQTIQLPATTNNKVALIGQGVRDSLIRPNASVHTAILVGAPGASVAYAEIANVTVTGANVSAHTGCGIDMVRPQNCLINFVNIEEFDGAGGTGLYMRGDPTNSPPHAYRTFVQRLIVATTRRPLYLINADENDFIACSLNVATGMTSAVTCLEIAQGRNNRFYGFVCGGSAGDLTARVNYTGAYFPSPVTGDNLGHQFHGVVMEGFDSGFSIAASNVTGIWITGYNSSINSTRISDNGRATVLLAPYHEIFQWPVGSAQSPAFAFRSEASLGWYRSNVSAMELSYGQLVLPVFPSLNTPSLTFSGDTNTGISYQQDDLFNLVAGGVLTARVGKTYLGMVSGDQGGPSLRYTSEQSLGWFRSGVSTLALSYGSFNLNQARLVSMRTIAASALTASAANTNVAVNEAVFTIQASGASFAVNSGGTTWIFNSDASAKNA